MPKLTQVPRGQDFVDKSTLWCSRAWIEWFNELRNILNGISGGSPAVTKITSILPIVNTPNPIIGIGTTAHATSGVTAATYGDSTHVAQVTFDQWGHATTATNVPIAGGGGGNTGFFWALFFGDA